MSHSLREFPQTTWANPGDSPYTEAEWFLFLSVMCAPCKQRLHKLCTGKPALHVHATSSHCSSSHRGGGRQLFHAERHSLSWEDQQTCNCSSKLIGKQTQRSSFYHFWDGMKTKSFWVPTAVPDSDPDFWFACKLNKALWKPRSPCYPQGKQCNAVCGSQQSDPK